MLRDSLVDAFPFDVPLTELRRRRSAKWTSFPDDVLPLPVAEMDVRLAPPILAALQGALDVSDTGYAGNPEALIASFCGFAERRWNWRIDVRDVRACTDVAVGIIEVLRRVAAPGDGVIITPPVYPRFYAWLRETGLRPVEVPLIDLEQGGRLDLAGIEAALAAGTRVVLLCHPHNPTGCVHEADELRALAKLCARYAATVLSDEIHGPLTYRRADFSPYLTLNDEARATGFAFTSASKAWNIPGLKCALIVADSVHHERVLKQLPHERAWGVGHLGVIAGTVAFNAGGPWLDGVIEALETNAFVLRELLRTHVPSIKMAVPHASYLAWLDCSAVPLAAEPARVFLERGRVGLSPGRSFGPQGARHARLNFACSREVLLDAVERIAHALS